MAYCQRCSFQDEDRGLNGDLQLQLGEVEEEILQLEARLGKLREKRRALKLRINIQLSPLLRLPIEILREIFVAAFPEERVGVDKDDSITERNSTTPLLLGSICSSFRDIAWSTPHLWSTVYVEVRDESRYRRSKASLLEEWLQRSQKLPILVYLQLASPSSRDDSVMWKIMDLVSRHSEQWRDVYFDIPYFFEAENCSVPKSFPQLRSLSILNPELSISCIHANMFRRAPMLNEVSLQSYSSLLFPTDSLSRLTITGYVRSSNLLQLMKCYPHLVHCAFAPIAGFGSTYQRVTVEASSLRSLEIYPIACAIEFIAPLLDSLCVPCLQELTIRTDGHLLFPHGSLASILLRSACPLVRLTLHGIRMSDAELVECLATIPSLRELDLGDMAIGTHTIHELTPREDEASPILVPLLRILSITLTVEKLLFDSLAKMAESRRQRITDTLRGTDQVAQMKFITVHLSGVGTLSEDLPTLAILERLQALEAGGTKVEIKMLG